MRVTHTGTLQNVPSASEESPEGASVLAVEEVEVMLVVFGGGEAGGIDGGGVDGGGPIGSRLAFISVLVLSCG